MSRNDDPVVPFARRQRGFEAAGALVRKPVRKAAESRGFAVTRLLTHWDEVAGPDLAPLCRPERISYGKGGFGATLRLLVSGAAAPLVQMQADALRERINALYGYAAIARVTLTQTSETGLAGGLAEAQAPFAARPRPASATVGNNFAPASGRALERLRDVAGGLTADVTDPGLRAALEDLATRVLARRTPQD